MQALFVVATVRQISTIIFKQNLVKLAFQFLLLIFCLRSADSHPVISSCNKCVSKDSSISQALYNQVQDTALRHGLWMSWTYALPQCHDPFDDNSAVPIIPLCYSPCYKFTMTATTKDGNKYDIVSRGCRDQLIEPKFTGFYPKDGHCFNVTFPALSSPRKHSTRRSADRLQHLSGILCYCRGRLCNGEIAQQLPLIYDEAPELLGPIRIDGVEFQRSPSSAPTLSSTDHEPAEPGTSDDVIYDYDDVTPPSEAATTSSTIAGQELLPEAATTKAIAFNETRFLVVVESTTAMIEIVLGSDVAFEEVENTTPTVEEPVTATNEVPGAEEEDVPDSSATPEEIVPVASTMLVDVESSVTEEYSEHIEPTEATSEIPEPPQSSAENTSEPESAAETESTSASEGVTTSVAEGADNDVVPAAPETSTSPATAVVVVTLEDEDTSMTPETDTASSEAVEEDELTAVPVSKDDEDYVWWTTRKGTTAISPDHIGSSEDTGDGENISLSVIADEVTSPSSVTYSEVTFQTVTDSQISTTDADVAQHTTGETGVETTTPLLPNEFTATTVMATSSPKMFTLDVTHVVDVPATTIEVHSQDIAAEEIIATKEDMATEPSEASTSTLAETTSLEQKIEEPEYLESPEELQQTTPSSNEVTEAETSIIEAAAEEAEEYYEVEEDLTYESTTTTTELPSGVVLLITEQVSATAKDGQAAIASTVDELSDLTTTTIDNELHPASTTFDYDAYDDAKKTAAVTSEPLQAPSAMPEAAVNVVQEEYVAPAAEDIRGPPHSEAEDVATPSTTSATISELSSDAEESKATSTQPLPPDIIVELETNINQPLPTVCPTEAPLPAMKQVELEILEQAVLTGAAPEDGIEKTVKIVRPAHAQPVPKEEKPEEDYDYGEKVVVYKGTHPEEPLFFKPFHTTATTAISASSGFTLEADDQSGTTAMDSEPEPVAAAAANAEVSTISVVTSSMMRDAEYAETVFDYAVDDLVDHGVPIEPTPHHPASTVSALPTAVGVAAVASQQQKVDVHGFSGVQKLEPPQSYLLQTITVPVPVPTISTERPLRKQVYYSAIDKFHNIEIPVVEPGHHPPVSSEQQKPVLAPPFRRQPGQVRTVVVLPPDPGADYHNQKPSQNMVLIGPGGTQHQVAPQREMTPPHPETEPDLESNPPDTQGHVTIDVQISNIPPWCQGWFIEGGGKPRLKGAQAKRLVRQTSECAVTYSGTDRCWHNARLPYRNWLISSISVLVTMLYYVNCVCC